MLIAGCRLQRFAYLPPCGREPWGRAGCGCCVSRRMFSRWVQGWMNVGSTLPAAAVCWPFPPGHEHLLLDAEPSQPNLDVLTAQPSALCVDPLVHDHSAAVQGLTIHLQTVGIIMSINASCHALPPCTVTLRPCALTFPCLGCCAGAHHPPADCGHHHEHQRVVAQHPHPPGQLHKRPHWLGLQGGSSWLYDVTYTRVRRRPQGRK